MKKRAFTLIELLIVITIIGILAVALIPRIIGGSADARDARRQTDSSTISTALEYYLNENGSFSDLKTAVGGAVFCSDEGAFATAVAGVVKSVPSDPIDDHINGKSGNCEGSYEVYLLTDSSGTYTRYAVVSTLESPKVADYVYKTVDSSKTAYDDFADALVAYDDASGSETGYYVIY